MATRGHKRSGSGPAATTPLQGALREDGEESIENTAFALMLQRMAAFEQQQILMQQYLEKAFTSQQEQIKALNKALAAEKRRSVEAQELTHKKMQELLETRRPDPATREAMIRAEQERIDKEQKQRRVEFVQVLRDAPKGTIVSYEPHSVCLILNGLRHTIKPGKNTGVPAPYIKAWEQRAELKDWASKFEMDLRAAEDANVVQRLRGQGPLYDPERGILL